MASLASAYLCQLGEEGSTRRTGLHAGLHLSILKRKKETELNLPLVVG